MNTKGDITVQVLSQLCATDNNTKNDVKWCGAIVISIQLVQLTMGSKHGLANVMVKDAIITG